MPVVARVTAEAGKVLALELVPASSSIGRSCRNCTHGQRGAKYLGRAVAIGVLQKGCNAPTDLNQDIPK